MGANAVSGRAGRHLVRGQGGAPREVTGGVLARGVLWLGGSGAQASDRKCMCGGSEDRIGETAVLGSTHGPRLLELLNAFGG